jgi:hypothetical protein
VQNDHQPINRGRISRYALHGFLVWLSTTMVNQQGQTNSTVINTGTISSRLQQKNPISCKSSGQTVCKNNKCIISKDATSLAFASPCQVRVRQVQVRDASDSSQVRVWGCQTWLRVSGLCASPSQVRWRVQIELFYLMTTVFDCREQHWQTFVNMN